MPIYDYKCKECANVFEVFRRLLELDKQVDCPNCGSEKTEIVFSVPHIEGETVAGSGYGKTEFPPINPESSRGMGRGMGRGLGKGPRDGKRPWKGMENIVRFDLRQELLGNLKRGRNHYGNF